MKRSYHNHIKHLVDRNDKVIDISRRRLHWQVVEHDANQLDGKQRHAGFDYYEHDMPKFGTPGRAQSSVNRSSLDFQEHLEDLEHDQTRHQGIHGHGHGETCCIRRVPPVSKRKMGLYKYY